LRLESVQNALDQAKACAAAMLDTPVPYAATPWFWSDQFDVKFQSAGLPQGYTQSVWRDGDKPRSGSNWLYSGERLICVEAMNDPRAYMMGKRWLEGEMSPDPVQIGDASIGLKEVKAS
jgi:3-phenylpropionate/trans-cinnamate dioxygenase ferredoxin reductase subunit